RINISAVAQILFSRTSSRTSLYSISPPSSPKTFFKILVRSRKNFDQSFNPRPKARELAASKIGWIIFCGMPKTVFQLCCAAALVLLPGHKVLADEAVLFSESFWDVKGYVIGQTDGKIA